MPEPTWHVSPYCVVHPRVDGPGATLVHARHGSRFELSADLLAILADLLRGGSLDAALAGQPVEAREAVESLIAERVLVDASELERSTRPELFRNRLDPLELAFHRRFNEGGYFPDGLDPHHVPAPWTARAGTASVPLPSAPGPPPRKDLVQCLLERRSRRFYADDPLPLPTLARFLELTARAHAVVETPTLGTISYRNYPSGGARYPLEIYPVVHRVDGLEDAVYHYHPFHHRLVRLDSAPEHRAGLRALARQSMGQPEFGQGDPAVLLVVTAVVGRTAWKYRGIPYHLILQETGALYQTMGLVATLLDLAACPIGVFPELAVADVLGVDSRDEAQVGMLALGVPRAEDAGPLEIVAVGWRVPSPFSPDPARGAVELTFADESRESLDPERLRLERGTDGRLACRVLRGRHLAIFRPAAEAELRRVLEASGATGPAPGPSR